MVLFNIPLLEWIGYVGSVIVAVSLTMSSIKKLRWYNLVGAAVFAFYGFAIGALPVGLLNLFIVLVDIFYLFKMYSYKESFKSIIVNANDTYLEYFLDFHQSEIKSFFPKFDKSVLENIAENKKTFSLLLLRNAMVAGILVGIKNNQILYVYLDFVIKEYRDLKPGEFFYKQNISFLKNQGINQIICNTENQYHQKYLQKMGFSLQVNSVNVYVKEI
ncbi:MAG: hypothetical protein Q7U47_14995 [Paludibacter sp.]|nr:hypothetical protein [Paludibacter sp.]